MKFFILVILPAMALATQGLEQCADWPAKAHIQGCNSTPCVVKLGTTNFGATEFTAKKAIQHPTLEVRVTNGTLVVPIDESDVCKLLFKGQSCPLEAGSSYDVLIYFKILKIPTGPNVVQFSILDDDQNTVVCLKGFIVLVE